MPRKKTDRVAACRKGPSTVLKDRNYPEKFLTLRRCMRAAAEAAGQKVAHWRAARFRLRPKTLDPPYMRLP